MSKKKPVTIRIKRTLLVDPEEVYVTEVTKSGNGAITKSFKKFIGKKAVVIIVSKLRRIKMEEEKKEKETKEKTFEDIMEDADPRSWEEA